VCAIVSAGSFVSMSVRVRGVSDWPKASLALWLLISCCVQATYGQEKVETPQQTNEKIQQLAELARAQPVATPIGLGDLLHIDVFDVPELGRDVRVSDIGEITFPLIPGQITAAGLTPFQLQAKLEELLVENGLVSHPQVSVFVREQTSQPVTLTGAVNRPMVYQVLRPTTLLEVLAVAGGISDNAGSVVMITRPTHTGAARVEVKSTTNDPAPYAQTITIRLQDLLESGNSEFNIQVYGGDVISIPRAGIVYILGGGIAQPGGYILQSHGEQITVLKAVALAHGLAGFSKADDSYIFRINPDTGKRDQIPVHIKQIQKNKTEDIAMKSNDILFVPDSKGLKALARGTEAAINVGTGVALYRAVY
jgi:polysaccharide export outer membrane protein